MASKDMNSYEAMLLFKVKDAKEDWDGLVQHATDIVGSAGGSVSNATQWDERKLTYNIKNESRATYMLMHFDSPPSGIDSIRRSYRLSDRILRALILRNDEKAETQASQQEVENG